MKHIFLILLSVLLFGFTDASSKVIWKTNYEDALNTAKKHDKNILVYFTGSDWCGPCKMLKSDLFATEEFELLSKNYTLLYIDIPRNEDLLSAEQMAHNRDVFKKLNKKGVFPLFLALNNKGKILDRHSGYSMNGDVSYHLNFLKKNQ